MKILHCIPSMGGGGAERQLCYMVEQMSKENIDVHVLYFQDGENTKRLNISGATIHHMSCFNNYDPSIILKIVRIIRKIDPHLVQTWIPQIDILAGIASILTRKPFILSERASSLAYGNSWKNRLRINIGKRASAIVANSKEGINYWTDKITKPVLKVIRNGIPFNEILHAPKVLLPIMKVDDTHEIILFAGRYDQQKNLYNLLTALKDVLKKREKAVAILFGDGPQKESLINFKEKSEARDQIIISGYTSELWNWFKVASIFVSVSYFEGTPNTVLEAAAAKCPVVVSDIPEHGEILDEGSSYFVSVDDANGIADGIIKALSNPGESQVRAENAYKKIQKWSIKSMSDEHISFYKTLLNQKKVLT